MPINFEVYADISTHGLKNREKYMRTAQLVGEFGRETGRKIYTNSFNQATTEEFIDFLSSVEPLKRSKNRTTYSRNTIIGHIRALSNMLKFADQYGFKTELEAVRKSRLKADESCTVYLSIPEIQQLMDCGCLDKEEQQVCDLFVIGCCTALRYSDYTNLSKSNFVNGMVTILTKKTTQKVMVPYHEFIVKILERRHYNYDFLKYTGFSSRFNKIIKEVCRKAGITECVPVCFMENKKPVHLLYEKWELIGSHTARRSAATNMIRSGMSVTQVMAFTGHKTQESFFRYLRFTREEIAYACQHNSFFSNTSPASSVFQLYPAGTPGWRTVA